MTSFIFKLAPNLSLEFGISHVQGVSKKVDPFKFKLSIAYCIILIALIASKSCPGHEILSSAGKGDWN